MARLRSSSISRSYSLLLLEIVLYFNHISPVTSQCPARCLCGDQDGLLVVDCTPRSVEKYSEVPINAPEDTNILIMDNNDLFQITNLQLYPNLTSLSVRSNMISSLSTASFVNLTRLEELILEGNPLITITRPIFMELTYLQNLNLVNTELTVLTSSTLQGLVNLQFLDLSNNQLRNLPVSFLEGTPALTVIDLSDNLINSLQEELFSNLTTNYSIGLRDNPFSCDCETLWLHEVALNRSSVLLYPEDTVCIWPAYHRGISLSSLTESDFTCSDPVIVEESSDQTVLTDGIYIIPCNITGQPRPLVSWYKDGYLLMQSDGLSNLSATQVGRLSVLGEGSLQLSPVEHEDQGEYYCTGQTDTMNISSNSSYLTVLESTCFNDVYDSVHETDVDCGGIYCEPCNITQGCSTDEDCVGDLICLYSYRLLSSLYYISSSDKRAFTCADPELPAQLLEERLQESFALLGFPLALNESLAVINANARGYLSTAYRVPLSSLVQVSLKTIERLQRPLIQMFLEVSKSSIGDSMVAKLQEHLHAGQLLGTLKVDVSSSQTLYHIRLNL